MSAADKFTRIWERFFLIAGNIVFFIAFCLLLTTDEQEPRDVSNLRLFAFNLLILLILCAGHLLLPKRQSKEWKHPLLLLIGGYLLLFALQCVYVHLTYFYTGWDVNLMRTRVETVLAGHALQEISGDVGYSITPNNLTLFYVQYLISKVGEIFSWEHPYNLCIYVSCFCVAASCFFCNLIVRKIFKSGYIRFLYTLISTAYILFSPWIVIPYSDTYGMLFVALGMWAFLYLEKPIYKWPVLALSGLLGYQIKPTCIFLLFAAAILYAPGFIMNFRSKWKELCILLFSCLIFFGIGQGISPWVQHSLSFRIDPELKFPPSHFVMMGLNEKSTGGFNGDDYFFTGSIPTYEEKKRMVKEMIELRWDEMTAERKRNHFTAKFLFTFNDGTFTWAGEGGFFSYMQEHDNPLNDLYLKIFHPAGKYYTWYCGIAQVIWLQILLGILFLFLNLKEQIANKSFLSIALCGLLTFLLIFEARARYLFLYTPAFLLLSLYGYESLFSALSAKIRRNTF